MNDPVRGGPLLQSERHKVKTPWLKGGTGIPPFLSLVTFPLSIKNPKSCSRKKPGQPKRFQLFPFQEMPFAFCLLSFFVSCGW